MTQIEIDIQLIARERPAARILRDEGSRAGVHDVDLHLGMRSAVGRPGARAESPRVANQALDRVELPFLEHLALIHARPSHDQLQFTGILGRSPDFLEARLELRRREMRDEHVPLLMHRGAYSVVPASSGSSRSSRAPFSSHTANWLRS